MRTVHLHVGKHKTGTTSIQQYLADHAEWFAGSGINILRNQLFVPDGFDGPADRNTANCYHLAHSIIRVDLQTPKRLQNATYGEADQHMAAVRLNSILHRQQGDRLLVSAEAFSFLRTTDERCLFDVLFDGFVVAPLLYVREPAAWLASFSAQLGKRIIKAHEALAARREGIFDLEADSWLVNDDRIAAFFGRPDIISYEDAVRRDGSVIPSFLRLLGLVPSDAPPWSAYRSNRTSYPVTM